MKRFLAAVSLFFLAMVARGQVGPSLFQQVLAVPGAAVGDTYYTSTTGGAISRLAIGTDRQCHLVVSGIPAWSSGCFDLTLANTLANVAAPGTPAAGKTVIWTDLTNKNFQAKDDAGVVTVTVKPDAGTASNFLTAISSAGVVSKAQPAASDLSNGVTGSGAVVLAGGPTLGAVTVTGAISTQSFAFAASNGANQNVAIGTTGWLRVSGPSAGFSIGGFTNGLAGRDLYVFNISAQILTINHQDAGSVLANRITTLGGANVTLGGTQFQYAHFRYTQGGDGFGGDGGWNWVLLDHS